MGENQFSAEEGGQVNDTIVLVDENPERLADIQQILSEGGCKVISCKSTDCFLSRLGMIEPQLIILEIMFDRYNSGWTEYDKITRSFPEISLLILTPIGETIFPYFDNHHGPVGVIETPVIPERLGAMVQHYLRIKKTFSGKCRIKL